MVSSFMKPPSIWMIVCDVSVIHPSMLFVSSQLFPITQKVYFLHHHSYFAGSAPHWTAHIPKPIYCRQNHCRWTRSKFNPRKIESTNIIMATFQLRKTFVCCADLLEYIFIKRIKAEIKINAKIAWTTVKRCRKLLAPIGVEITRELKKFQFHVKKLFIFLLTPQHTSERKSFSNYELLSFNHARWFPEVEKKNMNNVTTFDDLFRQKLMWKIQEEIFGNVRPGWR